MKTEKIKVDALKFQKQLSEKLKQKLEQAKKNINESDYFIDDEENPDDKDASDEGPEKVDDGLNFNTVSDEDDQTPEEHKVVVEVQSKAEELGAELLGYQHGVFHIEFDSKDSANSFKDFIEEYDPVDTFEFKTLDESSEESGDGDEENDANDFRFWVYLDPKKVSFDYFDMMYEDDEDEKQSEESSDEPEMPEQDEESDEVNLRKESFKRYLNKKGLYENEVSEQTHEEHEASETPEEEAAEHEDEPKVETKTKSKKHPKKRIKTSCKPGYKYNHETGACEEVKDDELKSVRKKVRKHLAKKHSENKVDSKPEVLEKTADVEPDVNVDQDSEVSTKASKADKFED